MWGTRTGIMTALATAATASAAQGQVAGRVTGERGEPLVNAIVTVVEIRKAVFTDEDGRFAFPAPLPPTLQLRVRRLGYHPVERVVTGAVDTLTFPLRRVAVRLDAITVAEPPRCTRPGPPKREKDIALADAYQQLRFNAQQYELLTREYPFKYLMLAERGRVLPDEDRVVDETDTLLIDPLVRWHYRPGNVLRAERAPGKRVQVIMNLPTIDVFANDAFVANHCFYNGGMESVDGIPHMRIDFRPASRLRAIDLEGSILLDTATFQVRRTVVRLSGRASRPITNMEAIADFAEAFPSVGLIRRVQSLQRPARPAKEQVDSVRFEDQFLVQLQFVDRTPTRRP